MTAATAPSRHAAGGMSCRGLGREAHGLLRRQRLMAAQTGLPRRPERTVQPQELVAVHAVELRHLRDLDGARPDGLCLVTLGADRGRRLDAAKTMPGRALPATLCS